MNAIVAPLAYTGSVTLWGHMAQAKTIYLEQHDNYQKQTQRNRMYIHGANGRLMLSIPVMHLGKPGFQKYNNVEIDNRFPWQSQHWKSLQSAYRSSPYFEFYEDQLYFLYHNSFTNLYSFNTAYFNVLRELLGCLNKVILTKSFEINPKQPDLRELQNHKKKSKIAGLRYTQVFTEKNGFIPDLSVLDLLFNYGPESIGLLKTCTFN